MNNILKLFFLLLFSIIVLPFLINISLINNETELEKEILEDDRDLIIAMVAKAAPIEFELETLKVQAIIARTHLELLKQENLEIEDNLYMTHVDMKEIWGRDYERNYNRLSKAVDNTKNITITYENNPVQLAYHFSNSGYTQDSKEIWNIDIPYLKQVDSSWDKENIHKELELKLSKNNLVKRINEVYGEVILYNENLETQIQIIERTEGGYIKSIQVGNKEITGEEFRKIIKAPSSCMSITYEGDNIIIKSLGKGHGVGMSQYGANEMAKEGKSYEDIIKYYFTDINIKNNINNV